MLELQGLVLQLPSGVVRPALSASLSAGVSLVCGDEGTGKTTLLRVLADASVRQAAVLAGCIHGLAPSQTFLVDPSNRSFDQMGVRDYWQTQAQRYPTWREEVLQDTAQALDLVPHMAKSLFMLSTGARRKVMLAASIASGAPLVLWDQPFASLDLASVRALHGVLQDAQDQDQRAFVLADYVPPEGVSLRSTISLD